MGYGTTQARKQPGGKTRRGGKPPPIIGGGMPRYLDPAPPASTQSSPPASGPDLFPDAGALLKNHEAFLGVLQPGPEQGPNDQTFAASMQSEPGNARGNRQFQQVHVSGGGERGAVDMTDSYAFVPDAAPERTMDYPKELDLPPEPGMTNPYPVDLSFSRRLSYVDRKGRMVHVTLDVRLGFDADTWARQALGLEFLGSSAWSTVRGMKADRASAEIILDGAGFDDSYGAFGAVDSEKTSLDEILQQLESGGSRWGKLNLADIVEPHAGAASQFVAIETWLDEVDAERYREAHPDKPFYEKAFDLVKGLARSIYNNTVGAVIQAGKQLWDMGRLAVAAFGKWTGWYDYMPEMSSDLGKAADAGQGTKDLLKGMAEGMVKAPVRAWDAMERGDYEAMGEELGNTYFAIEAAKGMGEGVWNLGKYGAKALGRWRSRVPAEGAPRIGEGMPGMHEGTPGHGFDNAAAQRTMAGELPPSGGKPLAGNAGESVTAPPALEASHQSWMDQMRAATRGEGPEPPAWKGREPQLDRNGIWRGSDPAEAYAAYKVAKREGGGQYEVNISRDRYTGEYQVMIGEKGSVARPTDTPGRSWESVMHYHPNLETAPRYTLPAPHDAHTAMIEAINNPRADGRPHVEFVESNINGQDTRVAIVMGGDGNAMYLELGQGVPGGAGVHSITNLEAFQQWWWKQNGGEPLWIQDPVAGKQWVPSGSQAARRMMMDAADQFGHTEVKQQIEANAPEKSGSPQETRTMSGDLTTGPSTSAAPKTKAERIGAAPRGSAFRALAQIGMSTARILQFTSPADESKQKDPSKGVHIVQGVAQMKALFESGKMIAALGSTGRMIDPAASTAGEPYWVVLQSSSGDLWMVPSVLLEKAQVAREATQPVH